MKNIFGLCEYSDSEIVKMSQYIRKFFIENENDLSKEDSFNLGIFISNLQYLIRVEREIVLGKKICEYDKRLYENQLKIIDKLPKLIPFMKSEFDENNYEIKIQ